MLEIERKFLVESDVYKKEAFSSENVIQGYLSKDSRRTVRVRIKGDKGFITIKGDRNDSGTTCFEWEKEIPLDEAEELMKLCESGVINKTRHKVKSGNHIIEIDEFWDDNLGLTIAEIELTHEHEEFEKPWWLGVEVTGENKYYNSQLSMYPFKSWLSTINK